MTARRDLTSDQMAHLRACSAQGMPKAHAAVELGVSHRWINQSAERLGIIDEIDRLFPRDHQKLNAFALSGGMIKQLIVLAEAGVPRRDIARRFGCCEMTLRSAIKKAGIADELSAIHRRTRKNSAVPKAENAKLPRDVCPAVQWLTKPWRVAA